MSNYKPNECYVPQYLVQKCLAECFVKWRMPKYDPEMPAQNAYQSRVEEKKKKAQQNLQATLPN